MISLIKKSLEDPEKSREFVDAIVGAKNLTERKRFYMSTYGYSNAKEVILGLEDVLKPAENFERYQWDNVISWWKNKAGKRYDNLKTEGRLRNKLETWNVNPDEIDIIR
tara:strand:- start:309 stop:635 length:327 start_codon:yes stop_codon:yes gene_type:complete